MDQKPSVGRAVHYHPTNAERFIALPTVRAWAAIVTQVDDLGPGFRPRLHLTIFPPGMQPRCVTTTVEDPTGQTDGSWCWPPRV